MPIILDINPRNNPLILLPQNMLLIPRRLAIVQQRTANSVRHNPRDRRHRLELRVHETRNLERDADDRWRRAVEPVEKTPEIVRVRVPFFHGVA